MKRASPPAFDASITMPRFSTIAYLQVRSSTCLTTSPTYSATRVFAGRHAAARRPRPFDGPASNTAKRESNLPCSAAANCRFPHRRWGSLPKTQVADVHSIPNTAFKHSSALQGLVQSQQPSPRPSGAAMNLTFPCWQRSRRKRSTPAHNMSASLVVFAAAQLVVATATLIVDVCVPFTALCPAVEASDAMEKEDAARRLFLLAKGRNASEAPGGHNREIARHCGRSHSTRRSCPVAAADDIPHTSHHLSLSSPPESPDSVPLPVASIALQRDVSGCSSSAGALAATAGWTILAMLHTFVVRDKNAP